MKYGMIWKSLRGRIYTAVISFAVTVITIYLAGETFTIYWEGEKILQKNWETFCGDPETVYVMNLVLNEGEMDMGEEIAGAYKEISDTVGLKSFGAYKLNSYLFEELQDSDTEFFEFNGSVWENWGLEKRFGNLIWCLEIYGNIDDLFQIDISEGELKPISEDGKRFPILVSNGYRNFFEIGDSLQAFGRTYQVTGYLEPGGYFPYSNAFGAGNQGGQEMEYLFVTRYEFPEPVSEDYSILNFYENTYLEFEKGKQQEQLNQIDSIMEKWGILYKIQTVEESYQDALEKSAQSKETRLKYGGIFLLVNFFVCISISVVQSLRRRKEFGICQASGWTQKELDHMILIELVVEKMVGLLVSGSWLLQKISKWKISHSMGRIMETFDITFWQKTMPLLAVYLLCMVAVSYLVSVNILNQKNCIEMMEM